MRAWVTGATGFVGSRLVARLAARGDDVIALVRRRSHARLPGGVALVEGSLPEVGALRAAPEPDVVFHCAAAIDCTEQLGREVHVRGTLALAALAKRARFVHVSTSHVFGDASRDAPLSEGSAPDPSDAYGRTKLEAEQRLLELRPDAVVLRPPGIYGPDSRGDVIKNIADRIERGRFYHVGDGRNLRSWVFVETLVDALLHLAAQPGARRVFLVDDGRPVSRRELAATIATELGRAARFPAVPVRAAWVAGWCAERLCPAVGLPPPITTRGVSFRASSHALDTTRLKQSGFIPRFSLRDALRATLAPSRRRPA